MRAMPACRGTGGTAENVRCSLSTVALVDRVAGISGATLAGGRSRRFVFTSRGIGSEDTSCAAFRERGGGVCSRCGCAHKAPVSSAGRKGNRS